MFNVKGNFIQTSYELNDTGFNCQCATELITTSWYTVAAYPGDWGETMAKWLGRWTPELSGPGSSLAWGTALCSWARYFNLIVPLPTQVYEWVPANLLLG